MQFAQLLHVLKGLQTHLGIDILRTHRTFVPCNDVCSAPHAASHDVGLISPKAGVNTPRPALVIPRQFSDILELIFRGLRADLIRQRQKEINVAHGEPVKLVNRLGGTGVTRFLDMDRFGP